jgi:N-methylhydantoinase A
MSRLSVIGIDVGGTFTDVVGQNDEGRLEVAKVVTTPRDQSEGALAGALRLTPDLSECPSVVHGTTAATNAILERKGARTGIVTTAGFRDVLEFQTQERFDIWDLFYRKPEPLVPRELRFEVRERVRFDGRVETRLDAASVEDVLSRLERAGVESVAITLLNSYRNPQHETAVAAAVRKRLPGIHVTVSSEIVPRFREFDRFSTAVLNAYVEPVVHRYLVNFSKAFRAAGFAGEVLVMQSNGGVLPAGRAQHLAVWTCLSGPAGGVLGAVTLGRSIGIPNFITFDMGGTSTDVCLVSDGKPELATRVTLEGHTIALPMFNIVSIGAGGGSLASVDAGGFLQVGPQSAGADPGPACYGRGGEGATVTDALCELGLVRAGRLYGGQLRLNHGMARRAVAGIGETLGMEPRETADAIRRIADARMAQAVQLVSVEQGHDPRDYTLIAYGGAGPLHAASVAEEVGIRRVVVPVYPGAFSAYGLLCADFQRDLVRTVVAGDAKDSLPSALSAIEARARDEFATMGLSEHPEIEFGLDMRYRGQAYELTIPVRRDHLEATADFHRAHEARFGFAEPDSPVEVVNVRATARIRRTAPLLAERNGTTAPTSEVGDIYLGRSLACRFVSRDGIPEGDAMRGPLVIEEATATTFVPDGWTVVKDSLGNLILERGQ